MQINELKQIIENGTYNGQLLIFQYSDTKFIIQQYIRKLLMDFNYGFEYKTEIDNSIISPSNIFGNQVTNLLRIFDIDTFNDCVYNISEEKNLFILCKKISNDLNDKYSKYIIKVPVLEDWQIKDFVYSLGEGIPEPDLDKLINLCGNDIYRLSMELDKMIIFPNSLKKTIFSEFVNDGVFNDLTDSTIFDLCSAILKKDIDKLTYIYSQLDRMDVNPLGFTTILYQNVKDLIKIQLGVKPTPENTGIPKGKFYAIKYNNLNKFNSYQLIQIFKLLTDVDKKIKLGQLDIDNLIDYLIVSIFSV